MSIPRGTLHCLPSVFGKSLVFLLAMGAIGSSILCGPRAAGQTSASSPPPIEVLVDGKPIEATRAGFRVPASHKSVSFRLGKSAEDSNEGSARMRFMLEGVDNSWRQMASEMCLSVRFANAAGDQVGQQIFRVTGISEGWRQTIEKSTFTQRHATVRVPADSAFVTLAVTSSGPPTAMGVYVVQGLKILRVTSSGINTLFEAAPATDPLAPIPRGWSRSGTRPSMAKIVHAGSGNAFCIVDDDANAHAEWHSSREIAPAVEPGELLTVEWAEMYNIGMGNRFDVNYGRLNAGAYRFIANEEEPSGIPLAVESRIDLVVLQPFWKSPWAWISGSVVAGFLLWVGCWAIIRARIRFHLARAEQEHLIERERLRIARDLHDDLGVRLTHISLVSGLAENDPHSAAARDSFQRISGMARDLVAALYQTVWTVNPENDHLEALVHFLCQLTHNLCETAGIRGRIHSCQVPSERRVTSEIRHNVTLAVKEAIHNAIKHAGATEITAQIEFADPRLLITIADNGCGFDHTTVTPGSGLANMRLRMDSIGGIVTMETAPSTRIRFEVPIPIVRATNSTRSNHAVKP